MTIKTPVKATFTGSDVTGLAEFQSADFIGVVDGGTGAVTFSAGILKADGTNAFTTVTAPSGDIVGTTDTQTLTNKTINGSQLVDGSVANAKLTNSSITVSDGSNSTATSLGGTITFSGTTNEIEVGESSGTITIGLPDNVTIGGNATVTGNLTVNGTTTTVNSTTIEITNSFTFEGSTPNDFETTLGVIDPTADRTINLPNVSGTVITTGNLSSITSLDATSIADGSISNTEFQYLNGVTSSIQTQLDAKATNSFAIAQAVALG